MLRLKAFNFLLHTHIVYYMLFLHTKLNDFCQLSIILHPSTGHVCISGYVYSMLGLVLLQDGLMYALVSSFCA